MATGIAVGLVLAALRSLGSRGLTWPNLVFVDVFRSFLRSSRVVERFFAWISRNRRL